MFFFGTTIFCSCDDALNESTSWPCCKGIHLLGKRGPTYLGMLKFAPDILNNLHWNGFAEIRRSLNNPGYSFGGTAPSASPSTVKFEPVIRLALYSMIHRRVFAPVFEPDRPAYGNLFENLKIISRFGGSLD